MVVFKMSSIIVFICSLFYFPPYLFKLFPLSTIRPSSEGIMCLRLEELLLKPSNDAIVAGSDSKLSAVR